MRNSPRTNDSRSAGFVIFGQAISRAPALRAASSRPLPLTPPACSRTRLISSNGASRYALTSLTVSADRSCALRTTSTLRSEKSEGLVISASVPGWS